MRIGLDVSQTGRFKTGCGYFADSFARALIARDPRQTYILYPTFGPGYWDPDWRTQTLTLPDHPNVVRAPGEPSLDRLESFWSNPPADLESRLGSPDLVHSHNFFCPTALRQARLVYTLHDLAFLAHPEWTTEANWRTCFEGVLHASVFADHILAVSDFTRRQFLDAFPHVSPDRVSVISEASRFASCDHGPDAPEPPARLRHLRSQGFWLAPGILEPRKNLARLLDAFARLRQRGETPCPLVLFGGRGRQDDVWRAIDARGLRSAVELLGYVDDAELRWLYAHCFAFCYLSLFEGFGLPVVEAMSQGAAVLTSSVTSLPEVTGGDAILVDPYDVDAIYGALRDLASNDARRLALRQRARDRAARFTWDSAAEGALEVYRHLVDTPARGAPTTLAARGRESLDASSATLGGVTDRR